MHRKENFFEGCKGGRLNAMKAFNKEMTTGF